MTPDPLAAALVGLPPRDDAGCEHWHGPVRSARLAVVITGASSGIGRAAAMAFAQVGASVVLFARDLTRLTETGTALRRACEVEPLIVRGDVTSAVDVARLAESALAYAGRIDVLIAAAGIGRAPPPGGGLIPPPVAQMSTTEWDTVVSTNLTGIFLTNRAVLPAMIARRGGDIVNVSSARAGRHGEPFASAYCASKFAILGLSAALREEAAAHGIRVTSVLPDATRTPMIGTSRSFGPAMSAEQVADLIVRLVQLPRDVQPDPTVIRHFLRE